MADTAALIVALSAQISRFEKDLADAVNVARKRTAEIEGTFAAMNKAIMTQLSATAIGFQSRLGGFGTILASMGGAGVAVATGLGVAIAAFESLIGVTQAYIDKLKALKEASELIGLTATELKALQKAGKEVGGSSEGITEFVTKFVSQLEEARKGGGKLFDVLLKIDEGLLRQLLVSKNTTEAINILADAYVRLNDKAKQLELSKAAGGRGGITEGRFLTKVSQAGGVENIAAQGENINDVAERLKEMAITLGEIRAKTENIWGRMFAEEILQKQILIAEEDKKIAESLAAIKAAWDSLPTVSEISDRVKAFERARQGLPPLSENQGPVRGGPAIPVEGPEFGGPAILGPEKGGPDLEKLAAINNLELTKLKELIGLLGDAVTISEKYTLKVREINKAKSEGRINDEGQARALAEANNQQKIQTDQLRERLSIATEATVAERQALELERAKKDLKLTDIEIEKIRLIQLKERKELLDAQAVKAAQFPELKRAQIDFGNLNKQLDQFGTQTLSNVETAMVDVVTQAKTLQDAFKAMVDAILKDLARLLIRQAITAPLANVLQTLFAQIPGSAPGATGSIRPFGVGHSGGIIGSTSFPSALAPASAFAGAKHFQGGGMVSGVPIIAHKGEIVGWPNQLKHAFGSDVQINVINNAPGVDVQTKKRDEGGVTAIDFIINTTNKAAGDGRLDPGLGGRFGARPRQVRR